VRTAAAVFGCVVALVACGGEPSAPPSSPAAQEVHVISVELTPTEQQGILTFAAHNAGPTTDTLVAASCTCATDAEVVGDATIESQQTALFTADGPHVSFADLDRGVDPGASVDVVLTFELAGDVPLTAEVVPPS
jgi:copper(I)-binding protein